MREIKQNVYRRFGCETIRNAFWSRVSGYFAVLNIYKVCPSRGWAERAANRVHFHFRVTELSLPDWREEIL